jgi:Nucleotidyl transferase AbiEii toxin, Type IV TA system
VRQYGSPAAFRAAVDVRLRAAARRHSIDAMVLRRQAAFERLLACLARVAPGRWALKGGLALQTRLGDRARPSMDLDVDHAQGAAAAREELQRAARADLGDYFAFAIIGSEDLREGEVSLAVRYRMECAVGGTMFELLQVDVSVTSPQPWDAEPARRPGLLAEIGLGPVDVLVVPLERQIAEKLHAYTRQYNGGTPRVKDLVDFVLILTLERVDSGRLREATRRTFARRGTHPMPLRLPPPAGALTVAYRREAEAVGITTSLEEGYRLAAEWLDPVLAGDAKGAWDPKKGQWTA